MRHIPVLLNEVVESLNLQSNVNVIDCTLGDGGHTEEILKKTGPNGKVLGIDADPESLLRAKKYLYGFGKRVIYVRENFEQLKDIVAREHIAPVHGILMDLGWSSPQFEERGRGFSFQKDETLNMRYDGEIGNSKLEMSKKTAADLIHTLNVEELERIFREYAEEALSYEIAEAIVSERKKERIEMTGQLVEIILQAYRKKLRTDKEIPWVGGLHPATKVFQALRIAVNDELGVVERGLPQAIEVLEKGGRLAVITFHSLEDRIVKHYFKSQEHKTIAFVNKKPIECGEREYENNPRARSAKLRVIEKI